MTGLELIPFSEDNVDVVLDWRNSERIRSNMLDDSLIGHREHETFLKRLAGDSSRAYFVVKLKGSPVATIYFVELGTDDVTWGCYIGSEKPIPGLFMALVVIAAKYSFSFPDTKTLRSEVAAHNLNPIKLNRFLEIPETARFSKRTTSGREVEFIEYRVKCDELSTVLEKAKKVMPSSIRILCEDLNLENVNAST